MHTEPRTLFGRDRELAEADLALTAATTGTPRALLIGGDAGIGKTSLVNAVVDRARHLGFTVLEGQCLDIDSGESLAPVREALRGHVAGRPPETLPPVTRRLTPFLCSNDPSDVPSNLAVDFRLAIGELAVPAPILLVLEDMHWADRSTQDFATALARTMHCAFALLLTFRSDELTRRHPFRRALVDIGRGVGSTRLELEPLGRTGIAGMVERATGRVDPALVGSVLARSEGNPLYAEELLGATSDEVPAALGELLLARVDALNPSTRELIRLGSANGSRLDTALLAAAADVDEATVEAGLREALDANVLTSVAHRSTSVTVSCVRRSTTTCSRVSGPGLMLAGEPFWTNS